MMFGILAHEVETFTCMTGQIIGRGYLLRHVYGFSFNSYLYRCMLFADGQFSRFAPLSHTHIGKGERGFWRSDNVVFALRGNRCANGGEVDRQIHVILSWVAFSLLFVINHVAFAINMHTDNAEGIEAFRHFDDTLLSKVARVVNAL